MVVEVNLDHAEGSSLIDAGAGGGVALKLANRIVGSTSIGERLAGTLCMSK